MKVGFDDGLVIKGVSRLAMMELKRAKRAIIRALMWELAMAFGFGAGTGGLFPKLVQHACNVFACGFFNTFKAGRVHLHHQGALVGTKYLPAHV